MKQAKVGESEEFTLRLQIQWVVKPSCQAELLNQCTTKSSKSTSGTIKARDVTSEGG